MRQSKALKSMMVVFVIGLAVPKTNVDAFLVEDVLGMDAEVKLVWCQIFKANENGCTRVI